jgi:hypothetical protein
MSTVNIELVVAEAVGGRWGEKEREREGGRGREWRERVKKRGSLSFILEFSKKHKLQGFPTRCCWSKNTK